MPIFLCPSSPSHHTIFQFISRPKFSSNIFTHHTPSVEQMIYCYQTLYLLIIPSPPIRIPYIRSIIVTPHQQCLFFFIHIPSPPQHTLFRFLRRPEFSLPIVTHHTPSAEKIIYCYQTLYIFIIPSYPIRIPYTRSISVKSYHQCIFLSPPTPHTIDPITVHQQT